MIKVFIDGVMYSNVGSVEKEIIYDYKHDIKTLDGTIHRKLRGKRTNYTIVFFNELNLYAPLKDILERGNEVTLLVKDGENWLKGKYFPTINGDEIKGLLYDGKMYSTALSVKFERVSYDE